MRQKCGSGLQHSSRCLSRWEACSSAMAELHGRLSHMQVLESKATAGTDDRAVQPAGSCALGMFCTAPASSVMLMSALQGHL